MTTSEASGSYFTGLIFIELSSVITSATVLIARHFIKFCNIPWKLGNFAVQRINSAAWLEILWIAENYGVGRNSERL